MPTPLFSQEKAVSEIRIVLPSKGKLRAEVGFVEIRGFDLTHAEFGRILGVGQTQLSKYEMGHSVPTLELLLRLKAYSGRSIDWIVTGEESGQEKK